MKRRFALLTALLVLISALSVFAQGFADMPQEDSKYYKAFEYAISKKLIAGDGTNLNPSSTITYAEALTIISRIKPFSGEGADITAFGVSKDKWYYTAVSKAYPLGFIALGSDGKLYPEKALTLTDAYAMIAKTYGKTASAVSKNAPCTRADFILEIYTLAPDGLNGGKSAAENPSEVSSEAPTEAPTEFSDLRAKAAQEAMQVALGVRSDGSSYVDATVVYKDTTQTGWASGEIKREPSRPSGGSNRPSGGNNNEDNNDDNKTEDEEKETQAPTDPPTESKPDDGNEEKETEAPTDPPTEPEAPEPTYGDYDGPIDNENDNVIDDPFNDDWRPPGWIGDGDDDDGSNDGWDAEDEDFNINDAEDPDYSPEEETTEKPTTAPPEEETDTPTDEATDAPTDEEIDVPSDEDIDTPFDEETNFSTDEDIDIPSNEEGDNTANEDNETFSLFAWIFSKDWWFS